MAQLPYSGTERSLKRGLMMAEQFDGSAFVEAMSGAVDVPIPADYRDGVVTNLERIHVIAQFVLEFPLPSDIEPASTFEP